MMARPVFSAVTADGEAGISAVTADGLVLPHLVLFFDRADSEHDEKNSRTIMFADGEAGIGWYYRIWCCFSIELIEKNSRTIMFADGEAVIISVLPHLVLFFDRTDSEHDGISAVTADGLVLPHLVLFFDRTIPWQPSVSVTQMLEEEDEEEEEDVLLRRSL
ncbi:hypothetical protein B0H13DRAFT_1916820 [Mycena leptocephala]|nr:hypothetical protein B0H13DRAFT_1916820 [Mycena leptocephala]